MKFFDYLNSRHSNKIFTFEKRNGGRFAFLDILTSNGSDNFCTSVFRKKHHLVSTLTLVVLSLFSYKIGLIKTFLHGAFEIGNSWSFFDQEKQNI